MKDSEVSDMCGKQSDDLKLLVCGKLDEHFPSLYGSLFLCISLYNIGSLSDGRHFHKGLVFVGKKDAFINGTIW